MQPIFVNQNIVLIVGNHWLPWLLLAVLFVSVQLTRVITVAHLSSVCPNVPLFFC